MAKKRLSDLFQVGGESTIKDDSGNHETVWLQKLNDVERTETMRRADARRARVLSIRKHRESDEYMAILGAVFDLGEEKDLIDFLLRGEQMKIVPQIEAELGSAEEWKEDNYLEGLRDAWTSGLAERHAAEPDDPEATRVFSELKRFTALVDERLKDDMETLRFRYEGVPEDELQKEVADRLIELQGNEAWLNEFYRCEIWLGTRDQNDHSKRYFEERDEVDRLASAAILKLRQEFEKLSVDVMEGKGSPVLLDSSTSSEPQSVEGTSNSSGLAAVPG